MSKKIKKITITICKTAAVRHRHLKICWHNFASPRRGVKGQLPPPLPSSYITAFISTNNLLRTSNIITFSPHTDKINHLMKLSMNIPLSIIHSRSSLYISSLNMTIYHEHLTSAARNQPYLSYITHHALIIAKYCLVMLLILNNISEQLDEGLSNWCINMRKLRHGMFPLTLFISSLSKHFHRNLRFVLKLLWLLE